MSSAPARGRRAPTPERIEKQRVEREQILRAAFRLIGRSNVTTSVHEILDEAELSTRAFYRHFESKDELILTMCRTAGERVAERLAKAIAAADGPAAALEAWVHQYLAVAHEPRRVRQSTVLTSAEARAAVGFDALREEGARARRELLARVIREGHRRGELPGAKDPEEDARAVASVVEGLIQARLAGEPGPSWAEATAHTTELFLRAFGARPRRRR